MNIIIGLSPYIILFFYQATLTKSF